MKKNTFLSTVSLIMFLIGGFISCKHSKDPMPENDPGVEKRFLTIRQDASNDGDAYIYKAIPDISAFQSLYNIQANWTRFGEPTLYRSLLKFDLSSIKNNEEIKSAKLIITTRPQQAEDEVSPDITKSVNNNFQLCLIKNSWDIRTVSWNNQPVFSVLPDESQVFLIPQAITSIMEFDVTDLLKQTAGKKKKFDNNGLLMKMAVEAEAPPYEAFVFYSMNAEHSKRPYLKLELETVK
ncbi:DNRLRE domain-containing protein [Sporocytophaga myxococcoides]|uniref:DNRLRE domain-containing protein n=1 Tax=Sporocytophaga myxococcoides TaxID=153721 RepID=UPI00040737D3|nr:DNRLRE domain-containing protein [Sporocytophaga myxococcoides]